MGGWSDRFRRNWKWRGFVLPSDLGFEQALNQHLEQPLMQAFLHQDAEDAVAAAGTLLSTGDAVLLLGTEREEYVRREVNRAVRSADLLTPDGWWVAADGEPVHGACDSRNTCSYTPDVGVRPTQADIAAYLEQLPGDGAVVSLRCHV